MKPTASRPVARGFTLVEVLVALLILAVVAAMSWQGVDAIMRSREVAQGKLERQLRLQSAMAQWEADLFAATNTQVVPKPIAFDGTSVRITTRSPEGVQVVVWALHGDTLTRWVSPAATRTNALSQTWLQSLQLLGNEPSQLRVVTGVAGWQMYFWQNNAWANAQSDADREQQGGTSGTNPSGVPVVQVPPDAVRLVLTFADGSGFAGSLRRDVRTPFR